MKWKMKMKNEKAISFPIEKQFYFSSSIFIIASLLVQNWKFLIETKNNEKGRKATAQKKNY